MSQKYLPSTSRDLDPTNYAWDSIVYQAGRPMLDSELNLTQDILNKKNTLPSGMISYQGEDDSVGSFAYEKPYVEGVLNGNFTANTFIINPFKAMVNGIVIDVRNTNATDGTNKITLPAPDAGSGPGDRGDFVFLEVWRKDVTPAMQSKSRIKLLSPQANDTFTFKKGGGANDVVLTVDTTFAIGASLAHTARNMASYINDHGGAGLGLTVDGVTTFAETRGTEFVFLNHNGGASGNYTGGASFTLASSDVTGIEIQIQPSGGSDGDGKPSATTVYYAGNVLSDISTHLPDDIQDPNVNVSSTRRIQVQYRIRTQQNLNLSHQIFGFENGILYAQGSQGAPVNTKSFSKHSTDTGLWYAGDGSEADATALGTVDGYVYAIPLCYVFRRQSPGGGNAGFNASGSFNTGALHDHDGNTLASNDYVDNVAIKESDRPDGLFADEVAQSDVLDLRRRVYPRGIDFSAELEYQYHTLLDNENRTWFAKAHSLQKTGNTSGGASSTPLVCDVYGGVANLEGEHRRTFDHIARRWSDTPTTERIYIVAKPFTTLTQPSTGVTVTRGNNTTTGDYWYAGDKITIDLTNLKVSSHLLWATNGNQTFDQEADDFAPKLLDIGFCWHNDGHYTNAIEQQVKISSVDGLGSNTINITLEENPNITANGGMSAGADYDLVGDDTNGESTGSNKEIFIELIFDYASFDRGLSGVAIDVPTPDPSGYPTGSAVLIESDPAFAYDLYPGQGNGNAPPISNVIPKTKQVSLEYVYEQQSIDIVSNTKLSAYLPWRLYYRSGLAPGITDSSGVGATICTLDNATTKYQHAESKIGWTNSVNGWATGQRKLTISAFPIEPYPADTVTDSTLLVYYNRSAPMTAGSDFAIPNTVAVSNIGVVPDELNLQPLAIGKEVSVFLKTNDHYPFFNPTDQLGTHPNASNYAEYETLSNPDVFLDDLKINTGSVVLPSFVPFVSSVNITLGDTGPGQPPVKDDYSRVVYPTMEDSSYFPSAFAKNMSGYHSAYKTAIPCLMKIVDDTHTLYRKGEVVLVVFVKTNTWGQGVSVDMRSTLADNYVVACVYRTKNQLLLGE